MDHDYEIETESSEASLHETSSESLIIEDTKETQRRDFNERITSNRMTKYEKAYVLGVRANQLSMNAPAQVEYGNETSAYEIAVLELKEKKIPFIIRRMLPDNTYEDWSISEMIIPW